MERQGMSANHHQWKSRPKKKTETSEQWSSGEEESLTKICNNEII